MILPSEQAAICALPKLQKIEIHIPILRLSLWNTVIQTSHPIFLSLSCGILEMHEGAAHSIFLLALHSFVSCTTAAKGDLEHTRHE